METLPVEIVDLIYEYDGRYKEQFQRVIYQLIDLIDFIEQNETDDETNDEFEDAYNRWVTENEDRWEAENEDYF